MKSRLTFLLLAASAGSALAQYKCTAANGAITFQQTPCFGAQSQEKLVVIPNGHPPPASASGAAAVVAPPAPAGSIDKRMLANYERQHQRDALAQALRTAQDEKARRGVQRGEAVAAARRQFGDDPASAQPLRDALAALDSRYTALAEIDDSRIATAQAALDDWDQAQRAASAASSPAN